MSDTDEMEADDAKRMHVGTLLRCFLCHEPLPRPYKVDKDDFYPEWQGFLVSVFPYIAEDGSVKQQLSSTHVDYLETYDFSYLTLPTAYYTPFWEANPLLKRLSLQECGQQTLCGDYCRDGRPDCMVYLAHRDCWKVASSSHRWSSLDWSRLAVQTRPFEIRSWRKKDQIVVCHEDPVTPILGSVTPDSSLFSDGTPLGSLLARVRTLPTELQFQIMGLLRGTMMASLLQTKIFVSELLPSLRSKSTWAIQPKPESLQVAGDESSGILSCRSTSIMGRPYLRDLTLGRPKGSSSHIPIAKKAVRGVQFALGRCGLRGIRISYEDGSSSPWLGESSSCWIGAVRCCDLSRLKVVADELRVISLDMEQSAVTRTGTSVMWWGDRPPVGCHIVMQTLPDRKLHYYPGWQQCQYLPLSFGKEYATGLTVYLDYEFSKVIGIVSHGSSDFVFGEAVYSEDKDEEDRHRPGIPFHFAFNPGEHLTSVWLHLDLYQPHAAYRGILAIATNFGRIHHFGAYPLSHQRQLSNSEWVRLSTGRSAKIHGLVMNIPNCIWAGHVAPMFGVSQDSLNSQELEKEVQPPPLPVHIRGPTLPSRAFTYYLRKRGKRYGFSTASLNNITTIHVRKKTVPSQGRSVICCVGLRIVHHDSSVEILGRWDPRDKNSISRIFDASEGFLTRLSFHLTTFTKATIVEHITVEVKDTLWECQSLDPSLLVPTKPPDHRWTCKPARYPTSLTNTRTFDCTRDSERVAWWFTFRSDDICRDHGSPSVRAEANRTNTGDFLKAIQVDCDGAAV